MELTKFPPAASQVAQLQPPPQVAPTLREGDPATGAADLNKRKRTGTHILANCATPAAISLALLKSQSASPHKIDEFVTLPEESRWPCQKCLGGLAGRVNRRHPQEGGAG
jgi:hypothetical protein